MRLLLVLLVFMLCSGSLAAQDEIDTDFDVWLIFGNKVVFGGQENWRHSHELQWRADNYLQSLEQIFYEGVFSYTPNIKWEIVPDYRFAFKPTKIEHRPGFGIVRKMFFGMTDKGFKSQLVHQVKWQIDIAEGQAKNALRYVLTYNKIMNEKLILSGLVGPFWRFSESFTGMQFIRGGIGTTIFFDQVHTLSIIHAFGGENFGNDVWAWSYTPIVQLVIRINKQYKYVPAAYINF